VVSLIWLLYCKCVPLKKNYENRSLSTPLWQKLGGIFLDHSVQWTSALHVCRWYDKSIRLLQYVDHEILRDFNFENATFYLCQVNGVNGGDTVFVLCVFVCVCPVFENTWKPEYAGPLTYFHYPIGPMLLRNTRVHRAPHLFFCNSITACVCAQRTSQSDQFKTVKAADFKSVMHLPRDSPDMTLNNFFRL